MAPRAEAPDGHPIQWMRLARLARHPAVWLPAVLVGAVVLFLMGRSIGSAVSHATGDDTGLLLALVAGLAGLLLLVVAGVAIGPRAQHTREADTAASMNETPPTDSDLPGGPTAGPDA